MRCTVTTVLWMVIRQRLCVIQRRVCQRLLATFFKILIKTPFLGLGTLMIQRRNQPFYLQPFQTSWLMVLQGFLLVMPQIFHRIICQRSSMPLSTWLITHLLNWINWWNSCLVQISQQGLSFRARMRFVRPTKLVRAASLCAHVLKLNNSKVARNKSSLLKFLTMLIRQFLLKKSMMFVSITRFLALQKFVTSLTVQGCVLLSNLRRMLTAKPFLTIFWNIRIFKSTTISTW